MRAARLLLIVPFAIASCGSTAAERPTDATHDKPAGTTGAPAATNEDRDTEADLHAFETFLTALGRGDRELAATVATAEALAADDWQGHDGRPNQAKPGHLTDVEGTLDGDIATYLLAPGLRLTCEIDRGSVIDCTPGN